MFAGRIFASSLSFAAVLASGITVAGAQAVSVSDCGCFAPAGQAVSLASTAGRVIISGSTAPRVGAAGAQLSVGERVAVGAGGSATISVGSCGFGVSAGQEIVLQQLNGGVCAVRPEVVEAAAAGNGAPGGTGGPLTPLVVGGGVAAITGVAIAVSSGDDNPASP